MTSQPIPIHEQACFTNAPIQTVTLRAYNKDGTTASSRYTCAMIDGSLWVNGRFLHVDFYVVCIDALEALRRTATAHMSALWPGCNIRAATPIRYEPEDGDSVYSLTGMRLTYNEHATVGISCKTWQLFRGGVAALQYPTLADGLADNPSRWVL